MRRLDSAIPFGLQRLTRVTKLCVRGCVSKYRVFDRGFRKQRYVRRRCLASLQRSLCSRKSDTAVERFVRHCDLPDD